MCHQNTSLKTVFSISPYKKKASIKSRHFINIAAEFFLDFGYLSTLLLQSFFFASFTTFLLKLPSVMSNSLCL